MGVRSFFWKLSEFLKLDKPKLFNIVASRDGKLYEIRRETLGLMITPAENIIECEEVPTGFRFDLPKIPHTILRQVEGFFKYYCDELDQNEAMVQIFWDLQLKQYIVECPHQWVKFDRINANFSRQLEDANRYIEVCHIHSHNTMEARFSSIDDAHEQAFMIYAVIGRLHRKEPEMEIRVGYNGKFFRLDSDLIFENASLGSPSEFPEAWTKRVHVIRD
ncbi:hypothetical protein [Paenibacillus sp. IITD108]|uniref:hypothetical protein n=1 Tax=Paenibacillus sp. IITD108 TaxID=3116649 RepID=UPI002F40CE66